ncbi:hypothetical protein J6590_072438 [Homalodisca vitripennis]|nr:hypothetical protein J6590_072438 [Homalodisca vitripennis]
MEAKMEELLTSEENYITKIEALQDKLQDTLLQLEKSKQHQAIKLTNSLTEDTYSKENPSPTSDHKDYDIIVVEAQVHHPAPAFRRECKPPSSAIKLRKGQSHEDFFREHINNVKTAASWTNTSNQITTKEAFQIQSKESDEAAFHAPRNSPSHFLFYRQTKKSRHKMIFNTRTIVNSSLRTYYLKEEQLRQVVKPPKLRSTREAVHEFKQSDRNGLTIFHQNTDRIKNKIDRLNHLLHTMSPDLLIVTEHGQNNIEMANTRLSDYSLVSSFCRQNILKSGVAIYKHISLENEIELLEIENISIPLICEVSANNNQT